MVTERPQIAASHAQAAGAIAFQGELGAYGHEACLSARPRMTPLPRPSFEAAIAAVREGSAALAMLPVENSTYGRVADIHRLLPSSGLRIVEEAFVRVRIDLLGVPGAGIGEVRRAHSHLVLLPQCGRFLGRHGIEPVLAADTAGAAAMVARLGDRSQAALASRLAAEVHGLDVLAAGVEDEASNTTRFLLMARDADLNRRAEAMMTTLVFRVRNLPAALYKAMGGFATNGVNMTKLESYMVGGQFTATQFYADVEGHPDDPALIRALEELDYFTSMLEVLGTYPADPRRRERPHAPVEAAGA